jgi:type I restriction enzyme M protein
MYGQELNPESYAICKADMLIKGRTSPTSSSATRCRRRPARQALRLHAVEPAVRRGVEEDREGDPQGGRAAGLQRPLRPRPAARQRRLAAVPAAPDLQDAPAKDGGSRFGIVLNGSPLFTGGAGSGESEIRRYVLENDLVEAIIGLPTDMFYNTGISTYVWIVSNRKPAHRKGKVQLIDASSFWQKMRKSLGSKRKELSPEHIDDITRLFGNFEEVHARRRAHQPHLQERRLRLPHHHRRAPRARCRRARSSSAQGQGQGQAGARRQPARHRERAALRGRGDLLQARGAAPCADAWIDHEKTKVGYEIPFNRHFYVFKPPRPLPRSTPS